MHYLLSLVCIIALTACGGDSGDKNDHERNYVKVFTTAPVVNAVVSDATDQVAVYNPAKRRYDFSQTITYPVTVTTNDTTYVDVDYDGKKTAADLQPNSAFKQNGLKSFCQEVSPLTDLYYSPAYEENNISSSDYRYDVAIDLDIDICTDPLENEKNAKVLFGAYNFIVNDGNLTKIEDIKSDVSKVEDFFSLNLASLDIDKIKYYSFYNALVWLDAQKVTRSDTIHKPTIPSFMRDEANPLHRFTDLDVRDLFIGDNDIFVAAAHDEFAKLDKSLSSRRFYGTGDLDAFGLSLYAQDYNNTTCLFLANKKDGILPFELSSTLTQKPRIYRYLDDAGAEQNLTDKGIVSSNGFVSISQNKRFFGISTEDKGYYLIDAKSAFQGCTPQTDINASSILIQNENGYSVSSTFRQDGSFVYVANKENGISRYNLQTPTQADINSSKSIFSLQENAQAYNLLFYPNSNELLVTTDQGLHIYDVGNDEQLIFTSAYRTEGAKKEYFQQVTIADNFVVLSDGSKGVKILKLDSSYTPTLCGVEYFANPNDPSSLQRTTSIAYDNGVLYIGFESGGIASYPLEELLFRHCK